VTMGEAWFVLASEQTRNIIHTRTPFLTSSCAEEVIYNKATVVCVGLIVLESAIKLRVPLLC
jgi:hypothetical protein